MSKQIRVLQILYELGVGGIQSFLMNIYRNIDRDKIQFDFLLSSEKEGAFEKEIESMGGRIYRVTDRKISILKNRRDLDEFFKEHTEYKCVHDHCSTLAYITPLEMATKYGIKTRIIHSHNTSSSKNPINKALHIINKKRIDRFVTDYFACSDLAGKWLYEGTAGLDQMVLVKNGINTEKYVFDESERIDYRKKLGIEDKIVLGNVGRIAIAKNHEFLLKTFQILNKRMHNTVLLIVGDGPEKRRMQTLAEDLEIADAVRFLGQRNDVPQLLQAMDCFVMPSKWEGFPVVLVEVQTAGLPCYVSDTVTTQAKLNPNVTYLSLDKGEEYWANILEENCSKWKRFNSIDNIVNGGFDIHETVKFLEDKYLRGTN